MSEAKEAQPSRLDKLRARKKQRRQVSEVDSDQHQQHIEEDTSHQENGTIPFSDENSEPGQLQYPMLKLNLANHQKQVMSAIEASTERRNRATGLIKNNMYYDEAGYESAVLGDLTNNSEVGVNVPEFVKEVQEDQNADLSRMRSKSNKFKKRVRRDVFQEMDESEGKTVQPESQIESNEEQSNVGKNEEVEKNIFDFKEIEYPAFTSIIQENEPASQSKQQLSGREQQNPDGEQSDHAAETQGNASDNEQDINNVTERLLIDNSPLGFQARRHFMISPLPSNEPLKCYIRRYRQSFKTMFRMVTDASTVMMSSESKNGALGCNYYISLTKQMTKNSDSYMGKLRSNFTGSQYFMYDGGEKTSKPSDKSRKTLANVEYESNFMGLKGPRRLHIRIADLNKDENRFRLGEDQTLLDLNKRNEGDVLIYKNKQPKWNSRINSYSLNFGGRVKMASIKNFIIEHPEDHTKNLFVFGKVDDNTFSLEFCKPFSPLQAFGIAISCFDFKLACE